FGLHPAQVESVAWITGGNGLLFGAFALPCLLLYVRYAECRRDGTPAAGWYAGATAFYLLSLVTYPPAVALPFVALTLDRWAVGRTTPLALRGLAAWFVLILPAVYAAAWARHLEDVPIHVALWARPLIAGDAYAFYLYKVLLPIGLGPDYGRTPS